MTAILIALAAGLGFCAGAVAGGYCEYRHWTGKGGRT